MPAPACLLIRLPTCTSTVECYTHLRYDMIFETISFLECCSADVIASDTVEHTACIEQQTW